MNVPVAVTYKCPMCFKLVEASGEKLNDGTLLPTAHLAPCGAHCAAGLTDENETNVHIRDGHQSCPACNETLTQQVDLINNETKTEQLLVFKYTHPHYAPLGFLLELQKLIDGGWTHQFWFQTERHDSLDETIQWAKKKLSWQDDVMPENEIV